MAGGLYCLGTSRGANIGYGQSHSFGRTAIKGPLNGGGDIESWG